MDIVSKTLTQSVIIAKIPEHPNNQQLPSTQSAILLAKSPEPMVNILRMWPLWKARGRVVVLLYNTSDVHKWIETLWKKTRAADILAVVLNQPPEFFTWFPYKPNECSNVTTIVKINTSDPFPNKLKPPFNNCPLIAVTSVLGPFVINNTHGSEPRMFRDLAEKLGMTPSFAELPPEKNVWTILDLSYQPYAGLKWLFENEVDLLFSQMTMSYIISAFADFLMPHSSEEHIFVVPAPLEAPRATAIIRAFHPRAWTLVITASLIIYASMVIIIFLDTGKLHPAFVHTVAIVLNVPTNLPHSKTLLIFVVSAYMYSMHITTAYTSSFIVFLSDVPREKPMTTLEDIVNSHYKMQVQIAYRTAIDTLSTDPLMNAMNQPNRAIFAPRINLSSVADRETVIVGPKIPFKSQARTDTYYDEFDYPKVRPIKKALFYTFIVFYISKGHPLYQHLNDNFIRLLEGGFPEHYINEVENPERPKRRNLEPFGLKNVEGPFILHLSLLGVCTLAWIGEWIFFWLTTLKIKYSGVPLLTRQAQNSRMFNLLSRYIIRNDKRR